MKAPTGDGIRKPLEESCDNTNAVVKAKPSKGRKRHAEIAGAAVDGSGAVQKKQRKQKASTHETICDEEAAAEKDIKQSKTGDTNDGKNAARRRGTAPSRKAAQVVKSYKETADDDDAKEDDDETLAAVEVLKAATEKEALEATSDERPDGGKRERTTIRCLVDYMLTDSEDRPEPLDRLSSIQGGLFITGTIYPAGHDAGHTTGGGKSATKQGGRRVAGLGPLTAWHVQYSAGQDPKLVLSTALAQYECGKASSSYRKLLAPLQAQVDLAGAVHRVLCPQAGGCLDASFDDVCYAVARLKADITNKCGGARFALKLNGRFISEQLTAMAAAAGTRPGAPAKDKDAADNGKGKETAGSAKGLEATGSSYDDGPFMRGLKKAMEEEDAMPLSRESLAMLEGGGGAMGGIRIATDGGAEAAAKQDGAATAQAGGFDEDFELACRLQTEEYAQHMRGGNASSARGRREPGGGGGRGEGYIQVREEEIADDYPAPREYKDEDGQEEMDELVLEDPETVGSGFMDADDREGSRTLDHFAIYNAEGLLTSLELAPMVAGLDVEVNIFASGVIAEDTGDWGHPPTAAEGQNGADAGAGGSGAGGSGAAGGGGWRVFLTQIREWMVECGPDKQVAISIRTDVCWYRLLRPTEQYAKWFRVQKRCAQVAVQILAWLDAQGRAAQLSLADAVRKLSVLPQDDPAFISTKVEEVERFVVVHGQVILNLIRRHPKATIQRCGLAKNLREKMLARRHRKLSVASAGGKGRGGKKGQQVAVAPKRSQVENPVKARQERKAVRPVPMPATTTAQVRRIWTDYFAAQASAPTAAAAAEDSPEGQTEVPVAAAGCGSGGSGGQQTVGAVTAAAAKEAPVVANGCGGRATAIKLPKVEPKTWTLTERQTAKSTSDRTIYGAAVCGDVRLTPGSIIRLGGTAVFDDDEISDPMDEDESSAGVSEMEEEEDGKTTNEGEKDGEGKPVAKDGAQGDTSASSRRWEALTRGPFGMVQCIFTEPTTAAAGKAGEGRPMIQIRRMVHGRDTMLGDVAAPSELFLLDPTPPPAVPALHGGHRGGAVAAALAQSGPKGGTYGEVDVRPLNGRTVAGVLEASQLCRPCDHRSRLQNAEADLKRRQVDEQRVAAGTAPLFVYRSVYCPLQGMFREIRLRDLGLGSYLKINARPPSLELLSGGAGFIKDGVTYRVGDFLYIRAAVLDPSADSDEDDDSSSDDSEGDGEGGEEQEEGADTKKKGKGTVAQRTQPARSSSRKGGKAGGNKSRSASEEEEEEEEEEEAEDDGDEEQEEKEESKATGKHKAQHRRKTHKGSNEGLRPFLVVQLLAVREPATRGSGAAAKGAAGVSFELQVRRFYRSEDISSDLAYHSDWWDLYAPPLATGATGGNKQGEVATAADAVTLPVEEVYGKCNVIVGRPRPQNPRLHTFLVVGSYDPRKPGAPGPPPTSLTPPPTASAAEAPVAAANAAGSKGTRKGSGCSTSGAKQGAAAAAGAGGGGGEAGREASRPEAENEDDDLGVVDTEEAQKLYMMQTLDIFAGCGGLSEGMHQALVADSKWAIEYDSLAAEAFKKNNPDAEVFCNNCNVLLRAAMQKAGLLHDCCSDDTCAEAAAKLDDTTRAGLPAPGSVGFMMGGPPCQGYSGMNRFNKGNWSQVQNSMVMAYLSYCDFYRPRYFLLENVRNFVVYNGGRVFRLVIRTLLELGYQVRFGILNAGNFGLPQSRKRTFIWAAQPGEVLPEWPSPRHVFVSSQLGVRLPAGSAGVAGGGEYYLASGQALPGAPLRTVTVRDAIGDLPPVENGAKDEVLPYAGASVSAFQKAIRGRASSELRDHIVKPLSELNLERCRCIPKGVPGADWRVLQEIVAADPSREFYKGQSLVPFCLPNTADRHNGWRGLYGRLDPAGHFPTATTDPNPMGKVGQVFHPDQDRIVSVRECARSQGFPDHFQFAGNVHCRHRQVGNAVPPPLARALGQQLLEALKAKRVRDEREAAEQLRALRANRKQQQQPQTAK